jgi:hypothetical protein
MKLGQGALVALVVAGRLIFPPNALAGQQGQDGNRSLLERAPAANDAAQNSAMTSHSQSGGTILKSTLIGAGIGGTLSMTLAYVLRDCGNCSWNGGKAMLNGAMYGGLIGAAVGANLQRRPFPNRRAIVQPTLTPRVKAVSVQVRF